MGELVWQRHGLSTDNYFMSVCATREDEALGTLTGAYMGGLRGVVMMQTSGFALIANALASLVVPYQIPAIIVVSERGTSVSSTPARPRWRERCGRRSIRSRSRTTR
jgi:sulfopyruvate decarboxylase TPP-binding subunit